MSEKAMKFKAVVEKIHNSGTYTVRILENNVQIQAHVSGKMRNFKIRILPGDIVDVQINPVDLTKGRITYRNKEEKSKGES